MECPHCKHDGPPALSGPYSAFRDYAVLVCRGCDRILGGSVDFSEPQPKQLTLWSERKAA